MTILWFLAWLVFMAWTWTSVFLDRKIRVPVLEWIWLVLKWPALAACPGMWVYLALDGDPPVLNAIYLAWSLWIWWQYRNSGDDDFRRKLKKRIAAKVQTLAGRLVVVPT